MNDKKYNVKLRKYLAKKLSPHAILNLGKPSKKLQNQGFSEYDIQLTQRILTKAIKQHQIEPQNLKNLVSQINDALLILDSATAENAKLIISEKEQENQSLAIAIHLANELKKQHTHHIKSIHLRSEENILIQLEKGLLNYADEEKIVQKSENKGIMGRIWAKIKGK